jgi:molybdopterin-containing oxidoreductase family membrane subunit
MKMATEAKVQRTSNNVAWLAGAAVLLVIGAVAWASQLSKGTSVLGIGQIIVWGLYIAGFFTLAGLASGLLILAVFSDLGVTPGLAGFRRNLLTGAVACYVGAGFLILMDIGRPERVLNMIFSAHITSPFVWDFISLALGVIAALVYLLFAPKGKWLPAIAGIIAALVVVIEGWILSMSAGSPLWQGGMMPMLFLVEGLMAGFAAVLAAQPGEQANNWLRRGLLVLLPVVLLLNVFEIATALYASDPERLEGTNLILSNSLFWVQVVLGIILPFILLAWAGKNRGALIVAGLLVILGVLAGKVVTLVAGQALAFMMGQAAYTPTIVEVGGVAGVIGLAGLIYLLRLLPAKKA